MGMFAFLAAGLSLFWVQDWGIPAKSVELENGIVVQFLRGADSPVESSIQMHLCFPSGRALEPQSGAVDACLAHVQEAELEQASQFFLAATTWVEDEVCGFSFAAPSDDLNRPLSEFSKRLWSEVPGSDSVHYTQMGGCIPPPRILTKDDFLPSMLRRSRYASISRDFPEIREMTPSLLAFRRNLFHPRQTLLLVEAAHSPEIEKSVRRALESKSNAPFSMSFSVVEEMPFLAEREKVVFANGVLSPQMAIVFPAPARSAQDAQAFAAIVREASERFGGNRVHAWSGLGVGLFWIEYQCRESRFGEIFPQFTQAVEDFRDEMMTSFEPREGLARGRVAEVVTAAQALLAARYFWGAGMQDWENPQPSAAELRTVASRYLRRPASFVLWPESRKDAWKGFP